MRLQITHSTGYTFDTPVRQLVQVQRLWPADFGAQRVVEWDVTMAESVRGADYVDAAGNRCATASVRGPLNAVTVVVEGLVETTDTAGVVSGLREKIRPSAYLRATQRTRADSALEALATEALAGLEDEKALDQAHALSDAVSEAITYTPGATEAHTTAAEALAGGVGVCQDHAHALIAVALHAGLPARYVTGYLFADAEGRSPEAGHAWAEIHVSGLGWVGFDPANGCCPDDRYVRLCCGADAQDAAPIRGLVQSEATEERIEVAVSVKALGQQQQQ